MELTRQTDPSAVLHHPVENGNTMRVSTMAGTLIGSEVLRIAGEIRALEAKGEKICNLTVGDFAPSQFRLPNALEDAIVQAVHSGETNYPPADGMPAMRKAVQAFYADRLGLEYPLESIIIASGVRPVLFGSYVTLVNPGDTVVYTLPSWNNNHYVHLNKAVGVPIACTEETNFLPTRAMLEPVVRNARMVILNSPLNPSGTMFDRKTLEDICELVLDENRRTGRRHPLFLVYDQVYWMLTFGDWKHYNPVALMPEMRNYTITLDGISKAFAATGVRVGWAVGPKDVIGTMSNILGHLGAWAPKAEQVATAAFLANDAAIRNYHQSFITGVHQRVNALHDSLKTLRSEGYPVESITPAGTIYVSARFNIMGKRADGETLRTNDDIRKYLLKYAQFAVVPFQAFGVEEDTGWFRLSVGAVSVADINAGIERVRHALAALA